MAVKKAAPKKGAATKAATKKSAPKKKAAVSSGTAAKAATPKASAKKSAAPKKSAPKKSAAVRLTDKQRELLNKVKGAGEAGYLAGLKAEQRSIEALADRKLLKRGTKNKEKGAYHYTVSKLGEKHLVAPEPKA
jgi:hypothetical protein